VITKIEAAERQLDTAIKLFFENVDLLSSYTLAVASRELTDDLLSKRKDEVYLAELERLGDPQEVRLSYREEMEMLIKPEHRKEAQTLLRRKQNFLKHADRDHEQEIEDISIQELSFAILFSIKNFNLLEKRQTVAMTTFLVWFAANNPKFMRTDKEEI
jgi:hypothetical protein